MDWGAHVGEWVALALILGALLYARRYGGGTALESLERSNRILTGRVHELEQDNKHLAGEVVSLKARTDVGLAIVPVLEALKLHEERAAARSEATLHVLGMIADRLGSDAEAA